MPLIKLCIIFTIIVVAIAFKLKLWMAILGGIVATALLYQIPILDCGRLASSSSLSWSTISVVLTTWAVFFLQRILDKRSQLQKAKMDLDVLINNQRLNTMLAPALIGFLPSAAAAVICGDIVKETTRGSLDREEQAFVTSYFRHIPESFLPTYSVIIIMSNLCGVPISSFVIGMVPMVIVLFILGYLFYVRKVPKETGSVPQGSRLQYLLMLFGHLWTLIATILIILVLKIDVLWAVLVVSAMALPVYKIGLRECLKLMKSAVDIPLLASTWLIMVFKEFLSFSGIVAMLPDYFSVLPIPAFISFALIFFFGAIVSGSTAIIATCTVPAFAAVPGGGMPLMMLLSCFAYAAMQISPTHVCLAVITEHFHISLGQLVKKTMPVIVVFCMVVIAYYLLLISL